MIKFHHFTFATYICLSNVSMYHASGIGVFRTKKYYGETNWYTVWLKWTNFWDNWISCFKWIDIWIATCFMSGPVPLDWPLLMRISTASSCNIMILPFCMAITRQILYPFHGENVPLIALLSPQNIPSYSGFGQPSSSPMAPWICSVIPVPSLELEFYRNFQQKELNPMTSCSFLSL